MSRIGYIVGAFAVAIAVIVTWYVLPNWSGPNSPSLQPSSPVAANNAPADNGGSTNQLTATDKLPKLAKPGVAWAGVGGVSVEVLDQAQALNGQLVLRIIAMPSDGVHTVAPQFTGLKSGQVYRITAWVKPLSGANFEMVATDLAASAPNVGAGIFDLANQKILNSNGPAKPGVARGPQDWQQVWIDVPTQTGQFVVNFYVDKGSDPNFKGDGKMGIVLGGFSAAPPS